MLEQFVPIVILVGIGVGFGVVNIILSSFIGKQKPNAAKNSPYECGIPNIGDARIQYSVKFYMIALMFLLFDMETMFIIVWALVFKDPALQLFTIVEMGAFMAILIVGYMWAWKKGAFQWVE